MYSHLTGKQDDDPPDQQLEVILRGKVGDSCASESFKGTYYIESAGKYLGSRSKCGTFYLKNIQLPLGSMESCTLYIDNVIKDLATDYPLGYGVSNILTRCTVHAHNPDVFNYFINHGTNTVLHEHDWDDVWKIAEKKFENG